MPGRRLHILVVDDEAIIGLALQDELTRRGHRVAVAYDGQEGLEVGTRSASLDILVTDMRMPRMGGHELVCRLRERDPGLLVVLLSGDLEQEAVEALEAQGGVLALRKPIEPERVGDLVEALVGTHAQMPSGRS
jgi:CheY-like chemotaxis protein